MKVEFARAVARVERAASGVGPVWHRVLGGTGEQQRLDHARQVGTCLRVWRAGEFRTEHTSGTGDHRGGPTRRVVRTCARRDELGFDSSRPVEGGEAGAVLPVVAPH